MPIDDHDTRDPPQGDAPRRDDREPQWQAAFDPYYLYAEATQFRFIRGNKAKAFPVLLELHRPLVEVMGELDALAGKTLYVDPVYRDPLPALAKARFVTARAAPAFFDLLKKDERLRKVVRTFELCAPTPRLDVMPSDPVPSGRVATAADRQKTSAQQAQASPLPASAQARGRQGGGTLPGHGAAAPIKVMVGVIDDAIGFANARFRTRSGTVHNTRLHAFWGQDLDVGGTTGPQPSLGAVLDRNWIDNALAYSASPTGPDEEHFYRAAGLDYTQTGHKAWGRRGGHGTVVMDLAAGLDAADVTPVSPVLAAVQLPVAITADTSGVQLPSYVVDGVNWILSCATAAGTAGAPLPCVINLSYGTLDGPHDGTGLLDAALDEKITLWRAAGHKVSIVLPSGNGHLSQSHGALKIRPRRSGTLRWRVLPDGKTPSFVEIWLPRDAAYGQVAIRVRSPAGDAIPVGVPPPWLEEGQEVAWPTANTPLLWMRHHGPGPQPGNRRLITIGVFPTARLQDADAIAPPGTWTIELYNRGPGNLTIDAWVRRNDTPMGYPIRGRQSRLSDRDYLEARFRSDGRVQEDDVPLCSVQRYGSINGIAVGRQTVVAGGMRARDLSTAPYSAAGPTIAPLAAGGPPRKGPDALVTAEHSYARGGVLAAGLRSGSTVALNGTSVAAAQLTRVVAHALAAGEDGTRAEIGLVAQAQENARIQQIEPNGPLKRLPRVERAGDGRILLNPADLPAANRRRDR